MFILVIPAQAGIQISHRYANLLDSRLRGNDEGKSKFSYILIIYYKKNCVNSFPQKLID